MNLKHKLNQQGFTLAETLVTVGILATVSLGLAQLVNNVKLSTVSVQRTLSANEVSLALMNTIKNDSECTRILQGQPTTVGTPIDFTGGAPSNTFVGQLHQGGSPTNGLYIRRLQVKNTQAPVAPSTKHLTTIVLEMEQADTSGTALKSTGGPQKFYPREFLIAHTVTGSAFNDCKGYSDETTEQTECETMGGVWTAGNSSCSMCESLGGYWDNPADLVNRKCDIWVP